MLDLLPQPTIAFFLPPLAVLAISLAISAAFAGASYLLAKANQKKSPIGKAQPTLAERGSFVPRILGTQRVAALVAWLGLGSQGQTKRGPVASQQGWHVLCIGPAAILHQILENGKIIFPTGTEEALTPDTHPSGTKITLRSGKGSFYIYWGETDQPVNTILATAAGMNTRWPYLCYILWDRKILSIVNSWPTLEYVLTVKLLHDDYLEDSPSWMEGDGNFTNDGVNPAHAIYELLTEPYPHGVSLPSSGINMTELEAMGALLDTEGVPTNLRVLEGKDATEPIGQILMDCSAVLPQTGDVLTPLAIRAPTGGEVWPSLSESVICPPFAEKIEDMGPKKMSAVHFEFIDRELKFKTNVVSFRDDAEALALGAPKIGTINLDTVINRKVANIVSDRRSVEELASPSAVRIQSCRGVRQLTPGQRVGLPDGRTVRITAVSIRSDSPLCSIDGFEDIYSPANAAYPDDDTPSSAVDYSPQADVEFELLELPYALCTNKQITTMLARQRANPAMDGAQIYMGNIGAPPLFDDAFEYKHSYGELDEDMVSYPALETTGPLVHILSSNIDMSDLEDLDGRDQDWRTGTNVAVIGDEWCFFKTLTHTSGNYYRLDGLIRGRWTSDRVAHSTGDRVWLFPVAEINQLNKNIFGANKRVYYYPVPYLGDQLVDADDVSTVYLDLEGVSMRPLPPVNFRTDDGQWIRWNTWALGAPVTFKWSNRSRLANGFTAGTQLAGEVHSSDAVYMDGDLYIKIVRISDSSLRRTIKVTAGTTKEYTHAQLISDFGSEPSSFEVQYYQQIGTYKSPIKTITVTRR